MDILEGRRWERTKISQLNLEVWNNFNYQVLSTSVNSTFSNLTTSQKIFPFSDTYWESLYLTTWFLCSLCRDYRLFVYNLFNFQERSQILSLFSVDYPKIGRGVNFNEPNRFYIVPSFYFYYFSLKTKFYTSVAKN